MHIYIYTYVKKCKRCKSQSFADNDHHIIVDSAAQSRTWHFAPGSAASSSYHTRKIDVHNVTLESGPASVTTYLRLSEWKRKAMDSCNLHTLDESCAALEAASSMTDCRTVLNNFDLCKGGWKLIEHCRVPRHWGRVKNRHVTWLRWQHIARPTVHFVIGLSWGIWSQDRLKQGNSLESQSCVSGTAI